MSGTKHSFISQAIAEKGETYTTVAGNLDVFYVTKHFQSESSKVINRFSYVYRQQQFQAP